MPCNHTVISHISRTLQVSFNNTLQLWWPSCTTNIWMCHYYLNVAVNECIGVPEITHAWNLNGYVAAKTITRAFSEKTYKCQAQFIAKFHEKTELEWRAPRKCDTKKNKLKMQECIHIWWYDANEWTKNVSMVACSNNLHKSIKEEPIRCL